MSRPPGAINPGVSGFSSSTHNCQRRPGWGEPPREKRMCVPPQSLAQNTSHPPKNNERDMIDFTMSPETRKEKPTVPQPTGGSNPQTFPLSDMEKTSDDFIMPPEKIGPPVLYPSLAEMTQEENRTPSSDAPLTGEPTIVHRIGGPSACHGLSP